MSIVKTLMGDYLLVAPEKTKDTLSTTGIISQLNDNTTFRGTVIQVGNGLYSANGILIPMTARPGDIIVYRKSSGDERKISGEKFDLVREQMVEYIESPKI